MIVSYSRNFIFIKTKKTAGSTVEAVLALGCGPGDIITQDDAYKHPGSEDTWDLEELHKIRRQARHEREARRAAGEEVLGRRLRGEFYSHMPASDIRERLDPAFWAAAYKITVERHPYEKAVSQAFFRAGKKEGHALRKYVDRVVRKGGYAGHPKWMIDGKVAVDAFIRQENLKADLDRIGAQFGIAVPDELPRLKSRSRRDRRPAHEILSAEQKLVVQDVCRPEFEILGYEP
jgi:hypothetical protein